MAANKVEATVKGVSSYVFDMLFAEAPKRPNFLGVASPNASGSLTLAFSDENGVKRTFTVAVSETSEGGKIASNVQAQDAPGGCRPCNARKAQKSSQATEGPGQEAQVQEASEQPACEGG